jgi:predicted O-linked N-acetylglucosamine transferase (SPINDLY family)
MSPLLQRALTCHQQGLLDQASCLYEQILQQKPEDAVALQLLGTLRGQQGRYVEAIRLTEAALKTRPDDFGTLANYGSVLMAAGRHQDALDQFDRALSIKPDFFEALYNRAIALAHLKHFAQAVAGYDRALALRPNSPECFYNRGISLASLGRLEEALSSYDKALALNPRLASAYDNRGNVLRSLGQPEQALESFNKALALVPHDFRALYNRAVTLSDLGRVEDAIASYEKSLAIQPQFADAMFNLGLVLLKSERFAEALAQFDKALASRPSDPGILGNRGVALRHLNRPDEALNSYNQALAGNPDNMATLLNRALLLQEMGRLGEAVTDYDRAIAIDPTDARGWNGRGALLHSMKRNRDALANFDKAVELQPDFADALANRAHLRWSAHGDYAGATSDLRQSLAAEPGQSYAPGDLHHLKTYGADWENFDADKRLIDNGVRDGRRIVRPFVYQALSHSPADLQACSRIFAASLPAAPVREPSAFGYRHDRIRIGYVSAEFREQATAYLMAGLYERHDRGKFEVIAVDSGGGDGSAMRHRLEAAFDRIIYIAHLSDAEAADLIRANEIDILVNLNGYFGTPRMGVFARRAAPIQVNYLGFPATLGAPTIDYIIADRTVIPDEERRYYDEQVVYLPDSYQANDDKRPIARQTPSRASMGLPDNSFVFCNFNQSYKITPHIFASWMRILSSVEGSVLWLLDSAPPFAENLSRAAERHGVAASRLIFASALPPDQHLSRLKLADLFLDSLPYNAHTTASDALWAGLPLLTCRGATFPGRVAASLLAAAGLPELITQSQDAYEAMAIRLAQDRAAMETLRRKLADNRLSCPLFDTDLFRKNIEAAYIAMVEAHQRGQAPRSFSVDSKPNGAQA